MELLGLRAIDVAANQRPVMQCIAELFGVQYPSLSNSRVADEGLNHQKMSELRY
jgi:hypothetical protein